MTDEALWSTRNIAEYSFCPRLFYFMEVEGIFLPNADTETGKYVHRNVDKPSASDEGSHSDVEPKVVRSLSLSSSSLSLTATLDIAELKESCAVPVEFRKGRPKQKPIIQIEDAEDLYDPDETETPFLSQYEPWPTDLVQVGLQALLLEDAGYNVKEAVIYYAASKIRLTVKVDDTLKNKALSVLEEAINCAQNERPSPLVNDSRCIRCSLQPLCLPDEINYEKTSKMAETLMPRKVWPPRDDGIQVIVQERGVKVGVSGMTMNVVGSDGKKINEVPLANIESLSLIGAVQVSTQAVHSFSACGIPIAYHSSAGRLISIIDPLDSVSAKIRRAQVLKLEESISSLELSRALVNAKITNQRTLLMRNCDSLAAGVLDSIKEEAKKVITVDSISSLRGHEGQVAAIYFANFHNMIKDDLALEFEKNGRKRRPPPDPVNSCLSMAYSMLTKECIAALRLARLEPSIGAFHISRPGRPALALDLIEPFRPLIADSLVISAFNRGELREGHFLRTASGCVLTDAGRKAFFKAYGRRMDTEITHPVYGYRLSYRRMLTLHARLIAAWLIGDIDSLSFLTTR